MDNLKDILSGNEEYASEEELIKYLQGNLSEEEKYSFEKKTANSKFINDAVEGLSDIKSKQQLNEYVEQLNRNLQKQLDQRKKRKEKRKIKENVWILVAVLLILTLATVAYIIVRLYRSNSF